MANLHQYLEWYSLIFTIPLIMGILLVVGMAVGAVDTSGSLDGDAHLDVGHDVAHDVGHEAVHGGHHEGSSSNSILSLLGFGRVPLMLLILTMCLIFGGTGLIMNRIAAPLLRVWSGFAFGPIVVALLVMLFLTGFIARGIARIMPTTETTSLTQEDLVGCTGTVFLECGPTFGTADIFSGGDSFRKQCRSDQALPPGASILVIEYNESTDTYAVVKNPTVE